MVSEELDQLNGKYTFYRKDGSISSIFSFKNGKKHGLITIFCNDGTILREVYIDDEFYGNYDMLTPDEKMYITLKCGE